MQCQDIHPLLAAYVDGELSPVEGRAVEEHLAGCPDCRALLDEQREGATMYAAYPVEEAPQGDWDRLWDRLERRLPARTKRVTLESLARIDMSGEFAAEEEPAAGGGPRRAEAPPAVEESAPIAAADRVQPGRPPERRREAPFFRPVRVPRLRHTFWAHAAGIGASALVIALVLLSIRPAIYVEQMATAGEVEISYDVDSGQGGAAEPTIIVLETEGGAYVPMIWVAQPPQPAPAGDKELTQ